MTQLVSDPPILRDFQAQRAASATQTQAPNERSWRNNRKSYQQVDGAVSDGAIMTCASSPRARRNNKPRQSVATPQQQQDVNNSMGKGNASRARPVSDAGAVLPGTPAKEQAYAGPTFQASPAASALPMPKFSRSVPNVGGMRGSMSARLASDKVSETEQNEQSSPETDVPTPAVPPREESPLDFFFKADREEKEKSRSGSQTLSPAVARQPQAPATVPRNPFTQTSRNAFLKELDGDLDDMPSPRSVPNKSGRPQMGQRASSSSIPGGHRGNDADQRDINTQHLRNLLFQAAGTPNAASPVSKSRGQSNAQTPPNGFFGNLSPGQRSSSGPTTPQPTAQQQDHYTLHYGNRNLSPLFKAARDTPPQPSSLRQEVASDTSSNSDAGVLLQGPDSPYTSARNYLDHTARTADSAQLPSHPSDGIPFRGMSIHSKHESSAATPSEPRAHDVTAMENDLRRLLKLNVLS